MNPRRTITALAALLFAGGPLTSYAQDQQSQQAGFFAARRAAFESTGATPTVPPSLSADPYDPQYVFLGYMPIATREQEEAHFARLERQTIRPASQEELAATFGDQEIALVFVNAAGEKWGLRSRGLAESLADRRLALWGSDTRDAGGDAGGERVVPDESVAPQPGAIRLKTGRGVLGSDDRGLRSHDNGYNMTAYPWRAMGVLVTDGANTANGPNVKCSAFKVGERHLLTSAHCVFTEGGGEDSLMLRDWWPGADGLDKSMNGGDPSPNNYKNILWYAYDPKYVDSGWDSRDFAVLVLADNQSSCDLGWFGYREDYSLAGTWMWNFGYPGQNQTCSASPRGDSLCGGSLYGMEAKITRTEAPYIFFKHDVTGGHSGSPVYDIVDGIPQAVGLVKAGYTSVENAGIKIRDLVFDFIETARDKNPSSYCHP
jgi:V8-like Glu-specific endopeptidase